MQNDINLIEYLIKDEFKLYDYVYGLLFITELRLGDKLYYSNGIEFIQDIIEYVWYKMSKSDSLELFYVISELYYLEESLEECYMICKNHIMSLYKNKKKIG